MSDPPMPDPGDPLRRQMSEAMETIREQIERLREGPTMGDPLDDRSVIADLEAEYAKLKAARDRSAQAADQADTLYKGGRQDALTNIDAHRVLATSDQALAQAESKVAGDQVTLFLALGGGWQAAPPSAGTSTVAVNTAH